MGTRLISIATEQLVKEKSSMILRIFDSEIILNIPYWHEARMQRHPKEKKMAGRAGCNWDFRFESTLPSYICMYVCIIMSERDRWREERENEKMGMLEVF